MLGAMVKNSIDWYYTFRPLSERLWQATKWMELGGGPGQSYYIDLVTLHCSCPRQYSNCKHKDRVREILEMKCENQMHGWRWDERNQWLELHDIPSLEEMIDKVLS